MQTLREENAKLGNKVILFTFGFGKGLCMCCDSPAFPVVRGDAGTDTGRRSVSPSSS